MPTLYQHRCRLLSAMEGENSPGMHSR